MPAQIFQGYSPANSGMVEADSFQLSADAFNHVSKALKITPYEKIDLDNTILTVPVSQSRDIYRKRKIAFNIRGRESDFTFMEQLMFHCRQPENALLKMADGKFYSFIKPGTTQATQIVGAQTGTNYVVNQWKFFVNDTERYVDHNIMTELSKAEQKKLLASRAAALTGLAVTMKSNGVLAPAAMGIGSIIEPGFNQYAPVKFTNTGGTAIGGEFHSGELSIEAGHGGTPRNDNMPVLDRALFNAKFVFLGVSDNDLNAFEDTASEACSFDFNLMGSEVVRVVSMAQANPEFRSGTSRYDVEVTWKGHVMFNVDDTSQDRIVFDKTAGANIWTLNLANN